MLSYLVQMKRHSERMEFLYKFQNSKYQSRGLLESLESLKLKE